MLRLRSFEPSRGTSATIASRRGGRRAGPRVAYQWLRDGRLDVLVEQVREVGRPVAVVLSDTFNVLDKARTVAGLVELIQRVRPVPLAVLRCDVSAVGAVAFGAALGAVGTTTTSRHRPAGGGPPPDPARPRDDSPRLFVPQLLDYFKASQLTELVVDRDDETMTCLCEGCDGQSLFRFAESSRHPPLTVERHNLYATEEVAWNIVRRPPRDRAATWLRACRTAAERLRELRRVRGAVVPDVSRWLQQWCDLPYDRPNRSTAPPP